MEVNKNKRIAVYLAECGVSSRRKSEETVLNGLVSVNDKIVKELSCRVGPNDTVKIKGIPVEPQKTTVIALNKPCGYISTAKDEFKRKTVLELLKDINERLYPVGRLDSDSRGLIILTNDGKLAYRITHPKFNIPKTYKVLINGALREEDLELVSTGIAIEEKELQPLYVKVLKKTDKSTLVLITIIEGRKRILRKAFDAMGYKVIDLQRVQIGKFKLGNLAEGSYRVLSEGDVAKLINREPLN